METFDLDSFLEEHLSYVDSEEQAALWELAALAHEMRPIHTCSKTPTVAEILSDDGYLLRYWSEYPKGLKTWWHNANESGNIDNLTGEPMTDIRQTTDYMLALIYETYENSTAQ